MTPILRRDGSAQSADSAGKIKACAVATTDSSVRFHHRDKEYTEYYFLNFSLRALCLGGCCSHSYCQSGSSGWFRSHSGRRLRTSGRVSKLYSGGGEVVGHSNVQASHGSLPS